MSVRSPRPHRSLRGILLLALLAAVLAIVPATAGPAQAADPCGPGGNKIACENSKPGTPMQQWDDYNGAGDSSIQGFATEISVNIGERIDFKIDTDARDYSIEIFRTGYYGGDGARRMDTITPTAALPQVQPTCISDVATELYDCGNWAVSASWSVPSTAVSGVYVARLERADDGGSSHITFVVRDDASHSDLLFQTSDTTWQAYNTYGGSDFYQGGGNGRAYKVSYNRPVVTRGNNSGRDFYFANEYPLVRFLEKNGYDVSYLAGVDTHRRGQLLTNHKVFLSVGHDEYWSGQQRTNVEAARDAGVNLMFLSGNEMYWRTRFEPSADPAQTPYRTLVSYKETWANRKIDPASEWTGTWRDPRFAPPSQGAGRPENALTGTLYMVNHDDLAVTVSSAEGKLRLWRGTSLASLAAGASATLAPHTVGYESNEDLDNGFRPPGLIRLSTTTGPTPQYLLDFGNTVEAGTTTHHLTLYRAPSGALVFSAGSVQWTWGLDEIHDSSHPSEPADIRMQQAQVNLLADMNAQPATPASGLVVATASTDTTGPSTTINAPAAGSARANGSVVSVSGTATDVGGGRVAGVEVSTDGGITWHPATGTSSWTYSYIQHGFGNVPLMARATDDSVNTGPAVSLSLAVSCPCSIFGAEVPAKPTIDDFSGAELGLRFTPTTDGYVSGVRFYKGAGNGGTHVGSLWSIGGQRLATATFGTESASGWQSVTFSQPVPVTAGEAHVVSYTAPQGRYAALSHAFSARGLDADPLSVAGGFGASPAGVYGNPGQFPSNSFKNTNYYVDVLFTDVDTSPLTVSNRVPSPGYSSISPDTVIRGRFSKPIAPGTGSVTVRGAGGQPVAGVTTYDAATRTITFTPANPLAYNVTHDVDVRATDSQGNQVSGGGAWSFVTARAPTIPGVCPCSLFEDTTVPALVDANDDLPVTVGVRFAPLVDGRVTAIRFYKGPDNTGVHTGALWSADGTQLASGTFAAESTAGWQTLTLATPVAVSANADYTASYRAPVGRYSATVNQFSTEDLSRGPLRVASDSGAYNYGTGFPGSRSAHNYLVDVVFERVPVTVQARQPVPDAVGVPRSTSVTLWLSGAVQPGADLTVSRSGQPVAGETALGGGGTRLTFSPAGVLALDSEYQVTVSGLVSTAGEPLANQAWTFRTDSTPDADQPETLLGASVPSTEAVVDEDPVELGMAFTPSVTGAVTGVRFFKGLGNAGTHTGTLWTSGGVSLATVTFDNETPSGWQAARFSTPVQVDAGATYVVSYLAPRGRYSATTGYFSEPRTSGHLTAPSGNNGRFRYGVAGGFPTASFGSTNYFVDVEFTAGSPPIAITDRAPAAGATNSSRTAPISVTFSGPIASGYALTVAAGGVNVAGSVALSPDARTLTFTPGATLAPSTVHTVDLSGVVAADGAVFGAQSWSFTTTAPAPLSITARTPPPDATTASRTDPVAATFSDQIGPGYTMAVAVGASGVAGSVALSPDARTLSFTPSGLMPASSTVTVTLTGVISIDGAALGTQSWSFTTEPRPTLTQSLFTGQTPASVSTNTRAIEVGTHLTTSVAGNLTAIRFYKNSLDTGTHTVAVWRPNGTRLARVTVTGETATGWQTMQLPTPIAMTAGQAFIVSYTSPSGRVSQTANYFTTTPYVRGPLTATRNQNGRFRFTTGGYPNSVATGTNYFVDPVFSYLGP